MKWTMHNLPGNHFHISNLTRLGPVRYIDETGSTNADLVRLEGIAEDGLVIVAGHQTAGRGRLDRTWEAPPSSNLLFSVLLRFSDSPELVTLLTSTLAVAVVDTLDGLFGEEIGNLGIKWPNDVLLLDRSPGKIAGILAEVVSTEPLVVVVGLGLNVGWPHIDETLLPSATSLAAAGVKVKPLELLEPILQSFDGWLEVLASSEGPDRLRRAHMERSATIGNQVEVKLPFGEIEGVAGDISVSGALMVQSNGERMEFYAGDVVHLRKIDLG